MRRYADFERVTSQSLAFAADALKLDLADNQKKQLLQAYSSMPAWPDAASSLRQLKQIGIRTAILSKFTPRMLPSCLNANRAEAPSETLGVKADAIGTDLSSLPEFIG